MPSIFLSHSSVDKPFARRLAHELGRLNVRVWIDEAELKVGDSLIEKIGAAIDEMDFFGVVLSRRSVVSEWVQRELRAALTREFSNGNTVVLPILVERVEIPAFLRDKVYADFTSTANFDLSVARLLVAIHGHKNANDAAEETPITPVLLKSDEFYSDLDTAIRSFYGRRVYFAPGIPPAILERATSSCGYSKDILCVIDYENSTFFKKGRTVIMFSREGIHFGGRARYGGGLSSGMVRYEEVKETPIYGGWTSTVGAQGSNRTIYHIQFGEKTIGVPGGPQSVGDVAKLIAMVRIIIDKHTV
jgi:hypothetical protein